MNDWGYYTLITISIMEEGLVSRREVEKVRVCA
jgi:hypothetical protein